ncbi:uncharacterized protein C8Q71DRAFT_382795 [Rhodofomes roseus]|uniref:Uncharacterized protein n=1 Tax=Rhodofomes roseus TaxID=34475 RepID=A0ABQ8K0Q7_9APHY|nr:uncharacterized protein C8Q71DRAFT_382795 [Rhodofomes roseus]KAH9830216.1 hypothetical protein C8Q71DRAFT_382795 [Rhodofomes roseus]
MSFCTVTAQLASSRTVLPQHISVSMTEDHEFDSASEYHGNLLTLYETRKLRCATSQDAGHSRCSHRPHEETPSTHVRNRYIAARQPHARFCSSFRWSSRQSQSSDIVLTRAAGTGTLTWRATEIGTVEPSPSNTGPPRHKVDIGPWLAI